MEISVVLATRNRAERLAELLEGLRAQTLDPGAFEVVVVDDASTDATPRVLAEAERRGGLRLRSLRLDANRGPAAARNAGWRAAGAPFVLFTDDDCLPSPEWVEAALRAHREHPEALVQGRTEPRPDELRRDGPYSRTLRVESLGPYFQTCNVAYPRALLERAGGFDEERFTVPGGEDADLAWRAMEAGAPAVFAPGALVHHAVSDLGPAGKLRVAWRWTETMHIYKAHPGLRRRALLYGRFWKGTHYLLVRFLLAFPVRRRSRVLADWLAWPYLAHLLFARWREDGGTPLHAPYYLVHDLVELVAVLRGAARYRLLVL